MSSHSSVQRLGEELACSSRRRDSGQGWKTRCPPCPSWLVGLPYNDSPGRPAFSSHSHVGGSW